MATGSTFDLLLFMLVILLLVAIVAAAFWPPHRHVFKIFVAEHWDREGHHYICRRCICGKQKEYFVPLEDQDA